MNRGSRRALAADQRLIYEKRIADLEARVRELAQNEQQASDGLLSELAALSDRFSEVEAERDLWRERFNTRTRERNEAYALLRNLYQHANLRDRWLNDIALMLYGKEE